MTVFIDPVIGAALVAGLLPILPGLPCPTCAGRSEFRDDMFGSSPCPDCADGVWTPPDHPVTIGVTSAEPDRKVHPMAWRDDEGWWLYEPVERRRAAIVLSSVIGEATLRTFKVIDGERLDQDLTPELVCIDRHGLSHYGPLLSNRRDISSALPFLPGLKPDDTVYLLDGFTGAISCAECDGWMCKRCSGTGWERPCPFPVDAPDREKVMRDTGYYRLDGR